MLDISYLKVKLLQPLQDVNVTHYATLSQKGPREEATARRWVFCADDMHPTKVTLKKKIFASAAMTV